MNPQLQQATISDDDHEIQCIYVNYVVFLYHLFIHHHLHTNSARISLCCGSDGAYFGQFRHCKYTFWLNKQPCHCLTNYFYVLTTRVTLNVLKSEEGFYLFEVQFRLLSYPISCQHFTTGLPKFAQEVNVFLMVFLLR